MDADNTQPNDTPDAPARERLLQATLEIVNEVGVGGATTRKIAERAGVNLQLIQYYFGGKDGLLDEAQKFIVSRFFDEVGPVIAEAPSLIEAIRRGVDATWELAQTQPEIVQPDLLLQSVRAGRSEPESYEERRTQAQIEN